MKLNEFILLETPGEKGAFKALFIVGAPGSGKSSIRNAINLPDDTLFIDYDKHYKKQATQRQLSQSDPKDHKKMDRAIKLFVMDDVIDGINHVNPILADTVGSNEQELLRRITTIQRVGYDVAVMIVKVSEETSIARAQSRQEKEGRAVDTDYIKSVHADKDFVYSRIQQHVPNTIVIDNNATDNKEALLSAKAFAEKFYNGPIRNSKGQKLNQEMVANGHETISPDLIPVADFHQILSSAWYRRQRS
jgi:predicted ABC-type ATPase